MYQKGTCFGLGRMKHVVFSVNIIDGHCNEPGITTVRVQYFVQPFLVKYWQSHLVSETLAQELETGSKLLTLWC